MKGLGLILIEYATVSQAMYARREFVKKEFSNIPVGCSYFDEERFYEGDYDIMEKVIIEFWFVIIIWFKHKQMIDEQISSIFLRVGKYLNEHCCQYCCIRFWIVIFAFISFIYEVVYGLAFYNKHNDYHIYNEHYLIRVDNNHI